MARDQIDLHASEAPASTKPQADTLSALRLLKLSMGVAGAGQFAALASALGVLAKGIVAAISDSRKQSKKLASNKLALSSAALQTPTVQPVGLSGSIRTVTSTLQGVNTMDTAKLNQAAAAATNTRNPSRLQDFEKDLINQISDESNQETRALGDHLKTVQGMREGVQST